MSTEYQIAKAQASSQKWAWIWMAYSGFLFITPLLEPSRNLWLGTLAVFAIFVGIMWGYIRSVDAGHPLRYWMIAATFVLGLITFPWNQGASCLFIYAACFIPFTFDSIRRVLILMTTQILIVLVEGYWFNAHFTRHSDFYISWPNTLIAIFLMIVIGGGNIFFAEQKRADCRLRAIQEQNVALAGVAERERIARDLHDVLGHTLSVITLKAELAGRLIERDPARAAAEIAEVEQLARTSLSEVREAITGYRAKGLAAEIEAARRTLDAAGVTLILAEALPYQTEVSSRPDLGCPVHDDGSIVGMSGITSALTASEETVLALALREAVTNIVRHAHATTCTLRFVSPADTTLRHLIIEDNGRTPSPSREGNGLRGMRARIESIGGNLALESGAGTRLLITLPTQS